MKKVLKTMVAGTMALSMLAFAVPAFADDAKVVKLAVIGPMTGEYAEYGAHVENAAKMAVDYWNEQGVQVDGQNIQFEIVVYDDAAKVDEAAAIAEQVILNDDILAITNANFQSSVALVTGPVYQQAGILAISNFASHPDFAKIGEYCVRNNITDRGEARNYIQMLYRMGYHKIGICGEESDFGVSTSEFAMEAIDLIAEAGGDIECVSNEYFATATDDYSAVITKMNGAQPDAVVCTGTYPQIAQFAIQAKKAGVEWPIHGCGNSYDTHLMEVGGDAVEGLHQVTLYSPNNPDPAIVKFAEDYKAYCGQDANHSASLSYDATYYVCWLVQQTGTLDRKAIMEAAHSMPMQGVTGQMLFGDDNECEKIQVVDKVENGKYVNSDIVLTLWNDFLEEVKAGN